jgi:CBS domain-containing protein
MKSMNKRGVSGLFSRIFLFRKRYANPYDELALLEVKDVMTKEVMCAQRDEPLLDVAHTMIGAHISCMVVSEGERPVGIITERDFIKKLDMTHSHQEDLLVQDLMTKKLVSVEPGTDLLSAQKLMRQNKFRKLVVMHNDELKGIMTQTDLCRAIAKLRTRILNSPRVRDVMTKRVLTVECDEGFLNVKKLMAQRDLGSVVVNEKDSVCGIFTEFDLVSEFFMNPNRLRNAHMHDLVSKPIVCISPELDLVFINKLMIERNFRRLPVIEGGKLAGIVTQTDVARELYKSIEQNKDVKYKRKDKYIAPQYDIIKKENIIFYKMKTPASDEKKK